MWCASCQSDVAGEVSPDAKSLLCTTCGCEVSSIKAPGGLPNTRNARDLLDRWNTEELLDPYQSGHRQRIPDADAVAPLDKEVPEIDVAEAADSFTDELPSEDATSEPAPSEEPKAKRKFRMDSAHIERTDGVIVDTEDATDIQGEAPEDQPEPKPEPREQRVARRPSQRNVRIDNAHEAVDGQSVGAHAPHPSRDVLQSVPGRIDNSHGSAPSPHFNIAAAFDERKKPGTGESLWGQLLAYAGVGVLTVGTGLVVWGYFGGPDSYTPTGWLLATAGQMLLFLGVVTLISGGMEQTQHEVTQRIERLGDHIIRIERHTADHALRGPHYATSDAPETVTAEQEAKIVS